MKAKIAILLTIVPLALACCKAKNAPSYIEIAQNDTASTAASRSADGEWYENDEQYYDRVSKEQQAEMLIKSQQIVDSINIRKQQVTAQLSRLSQKEADRLYRLYQAEQLSSLRGLYSLNSGWLYEPVFSRRFANIINVLKRGGIAAENAGEGYFDLKFSDYYFYNTFRSYLSPELHDYLKIQEDQDTTLFIGDAAICISWDELGEWTMAWEKQIEKYPKSKYMADYKERYRWYLLFFLTGADNTPTFYFEPELTLYDEGAYNRFLEKYPNSKTSKILAAMLRMLNEHNQSSQSEDDAHQKVYEIADSIIDKW